MTQLTDTEPIRLVSYKGDIWHVSILLPEIKSTINEELVHRLREAKRLISEEFDVSYDQLELLEVISKKPLENGIEALVSIGKIKIEKGKPTITLKPGVSPQGALFADMVAEITFYHTDEFDNPIDMDRIKKLIAREGIAFERCDFNILEKALDRVHKRKGHVIGLHFARGEFPEEGVDAQLEYTFYDQPLDGLSPSEYAEGRKVKEGDILCRKIPPTHGKRPGVDVRGGEIPPTKGLDFRLIPGSGTKLSADGSILTAQIDGVATMKRHNRRVLTVMGEKIFPSTIEVTVRPVVRVKAEDVETLVLDESVEIQGKLKAGSSITTRGEVFLRDGVEEGATVIAGSSVVVDGTVREGNISSDRSVVAGKDVKDSRIAAGEYVEVRGTAENSTITGKRVSIKHARGSHITASEEVRLGSAGDDGKGNKTVIRTGYNDYYRQMLENAERELETLKGNLKKIGGIFGLTLLKELKPDNIQHILIQHLRNLRQTGQGRPDEEKVRCLKRLLEAAIPLKTLITEKMVEIEKLRAKVQVEGDERPVVIIQEPLSNGVEIDLGKPVKKENK